METGHEELLRTRVSDLLARDPRCLYVLVRHGFAPLRRPALRRVLAPTVDLGQAIAIRGLGPEAEAALLDELSALLYGRAGAPEPTARPEEVPPCR